MQGYVGAKGRRFYAVVYDGIDPSTCRCAGFGSSTSRRCTRSCCRTVARTAPAVSIPSRCSKCTSSFAKALADATRKGLVVRNVADGAEAPKRRRPKRVVRAWTAPQLQAFLTAARPQRLFAALWLAATTECDEASCSGCAGKISTAQAGASPFIAPWCRSPTSSTNHTAKTSSARRCIDLDPTTIEVLT